MGKNIEAVIDFIFLGTKVIAENDFNHENIRCLFLERKAITNLDSVL